MIYKSIDTIPFKIYFKIIETGDLSLLCTEDEKIEESKLSEIFAKIQAEDESLAETKGRSKELDIYSRMESLSAKYKKIKYALYYLRHLKDEELIEMLKKDGYKITDDFDGSLNEIERLSESLLVKIESIKQRLPKKDNKDTETPLDEVILSYMALLELGFSDTNKISQAQYRAIIKMGNKKIEALNRNGGK